MYFHQPTIALHIPRLYPKQKAAFFNPKQYSFVEASTKAGKTVGCIAWMLSLSMKRSGIYWWIAPILSTSKIAFRRMMRAIPRDMFKINRAELTITLLHNDSIIFFKSGDNPDSLFGEDVDAVVIDEASRCKEEVLDAAMSVTTHTRGPIRAIGNVQGKKNWFYKKSAQARAGDPDMFYAKITARDAVEAGVLRKEQLDKIERLYKGREEFFRELYYAEAIDSGLNPFGLPNIRNCAAPLIDDTPVVYGVDLGRKLDWTVITGLNADGYVCRWDRFKMPWPQAIEKIADFCGDVPTLIDETGLGDVVVQFLEERGSNFQGFMFTAPNKQKLVNTLAMGFSLGNVHPTPGVVQDECEDFEFEHSAGGPRYSAPVGLHDDCVYSLALAYYELQTPTPRFTSEYQPIKTGGDLTIQGKF